MKAHVVSAIAFLRREFKNDGIEGESVHLVCDMAETLFAELEAERYRHEQSVRDRAGDLLRFEERAREART